MMIRRRIAYSDRTYIGTSVAGKFHAYACPLHLSTQKLTGLTSYTAGALKETPDGKIIITLRKKLHQSSDTNKQVDLTHEKKLRTFGSKGILHLIWSESRLNLWFDHSKSQRRLGIVNAAIRKAAERIINQDIPLNRSLLLHAPIGSQQEHTNNQVINSALASKSKVLLIAPLKFYKTQQHGLKTSKLPVTGNFGFSAIFVGTRHWNHLLEVNPNEVRLWKDGHTVIALAYVIPYSDGFFKTANVRDIALMAVSEAWIPITSHSDMTKESALRAERISFMKPLRFDAPTDIDLPDYIFADAGGFLPVKIPT